MRTDITNNATDEEKIEYLLYLVYSSKPYEQYYITKNFLLDLLEEVEESKERYDEDSYQSDISDLEDDIQELENQRDSLQYKVAILEKRNLELREKLTFEKEE